MCGRGRKRQLAIEDKYLELILGGIGTVEASERVGMDSFARGPNLLRAVAWPNGRWDPSSWTQVGRR